jgi:hypothetical protein
MDGKYLEWRQYEYMKDQQYDTSNSKGYIETEVHKIDAVRSAWIAVVHALPDKVRRQVVDIGWDARTHSN